MPEAKEAQAGTPPEPAVEKAGEKAGGIDPEALAAKYEHQDKQRARKIAKLEEELAKRDAKLAEIEEAKKTEAEKAIEAAAKKAAEERDAHWNERLTSMAVDHALVDELRSRGYDPDYALLVKAKGEVASADDVKGAVDGWLKVKGWPEKVEGGAPPAVAPSGAPKPPKGAGDKPITLASIRAMTPAEFNDPKFQARWKEAAKKGIPRE